MIKVLASRLGQMLFVLWLLVTVVFFVVNVAGDPTENLALDPNVPPEARQMQIERLGLDRPLWEQYVIFLGNLLQADLGFSFSLYPREVGDILIERLPRTVGLFLGATLLGFGFGFVIGRRLAWWRGTLREHGVTVIGVFLLTVFPIWAALVMIWIFSFELGLFPSRGFLTPALWRGAPFPSNQVFMVLVGGLTVLLVGGIMLRQAAQRLDNPRMRTFVSLGGIAGLAAVVLAAIGASPMGPYAANIAHHTILPTGTLVLLSFGGTMLLTRTSMLETMQEDYVLTARAKGLPESTVRNKHVARTALLPVVASLMLSLVAVLTGSIVFERVFSWPGIGLTFIEASTSGDVPLTIGVLVSYGVIFMITHFLLDVVYTYLDPRIRY
ncbi:ABC transporter permease [Egibacter rhizosphaerae]|uniref:ABC transporter permease n=1 Tax=Egibacter rhizosphaerae TaxID=1670831 RepID=A0A411YKP7_9ACTN|nr:ABC transporter permease [Egibacter rhizosphaerae]QBI21751.1 ABC transporter permease [Egibacter rhizosphaerae]